MIRKILCPTCATNSRPQHPEDVAAGWKVRYTVGHAKKPAEHFVTVTSSAGAERHDLPSLVCDNCGASLFDGTDVTAVTYWRGEEPLRWEEEYLR